MHSEKSKNVARHCSSVGRSALTMIFSRWLSFSILKRTVQGPSLPMLFFQTVKRQKLLSFILLLITLSIGIIIGVVMNTGVQAEHQVAAGAQDGTPLTIPQAVPLANDFTKLTKRVEPSVVYI